MCNLQFACSVLSRCLLRWMWVLQYCSTRELSYHCWPGWRGPCCSPCVRGGRAGPPPPRPGYLQHQENVKTESVSQYNLGLEMQQSRQNKWLHARLLASQISLTSQHPLCNGPAILSPDNHVPGRHRPHGACNLNIVSTKSTQILIVVAETTLYYINVRPTFRVPPVNCWFM